MGERELAELASRQEALVTRRQARDHLTPEQLRHRLVRGRLEPVRWGVYRFAGAPPTPWQELRAACLAAGSSAVASHRSAAALWGITSVLADGPELTVPWPMWPRLPGVRCHQSGRLLPEHCTVREGVPATSAARTLADLSTCFQPEFLGRLVAAGAARIVADVTSARERAFRALRASDPYLRGKVG